MMITRRLGAASALLALVVGAPAAAGCWDAPSREAAQVRELQTMLMVASLRCHAAGIEITADYNGFVRGARGALETANMRIKTHFAESGGTQADYDRFTTFLANAYGDAQTDPATCAEAAGIARTAAASFADLAHLAANRLFPRVLPGDACAPASAPPSAVRPAPVVTIAAAAPPPAVARLPEEVVAALAVMARYGARAMPTAASAAVADAPTQLAAVVR